MILRRLYLYLVSAAGLGLLAAGLALLGTAALAFFYNALRYVLAITDATEDDVHQALANLPPNASYKLTPAEQSH